MGSLLSRANATVTHTDEPAEPLTESVATWRLVRMLRCMDVRHTRGEARSLMCMDVRNPRGECCCLTCSPLEGLDALLKVAENAPPAVLGVVRHRRRELFARAAACDSTFGTAFFVRLCALPQMAPVRPHRRTAAELCEFLADAVDCGADAAVRELGVAANAAFGTARLARLCAGAVRLVLRPRVSPPGASTSAALADPCVVLVGITVLLASVPASAPGAAGVPPMLPLVRALLYCGNGWAGIDALIVLTAARHDLGQLRGATARRLAAVRRRVAKAEAVRARARRMVDADAAEMAAVGRPF